MEAAISAKAGERELVVMKFGGTSVAGAEELKRAAKRIVAAREQGRSVVAVLSARGSTTDELEAMGFGVFHTHNPRQFTRRCHHKTAGTRGFEVPVGTGKAYHVGYCRAPTVPAVSNRDQHFRHMGDQTMKCPPQAIYRIRINM